MKWGPITLILDHSHANAAQAGVNVAGFCIHSVRAAATTNALDHQADIANVQE